MSISYVGHAQYRIGTEGEAGSNSLTVSGSGKLLISFFGSHPAYTHKWPDGSGTALTSLIGPTALGAYDHKLETQYLLNPSSVTGGVTQDFSGSEFGFSETLLFNGVDQVTPFRTTAVVHAGASPSITPAVGNNQAEAIYSPMNGKNFGITVSGLGVGDVVALCAMGVMDGESSSQGGSCYSTILQGVSRESFDSAGPWSSSGEILLISAYFTATAYAHTVYFYNDPSPLVHDTAIHAVVLNGGGDVSLPNLTSSDNNQLSLISFNNPIMIDHNYVA